MRPPAGAQLQRAADERMGIELSDMQARALRHAVAGRDTLVVSPTGSGKSAIYQLAGALVEGTTVVVSPLIALQEDQLAGLRTLDVGSAVALNSARGGRVRAETLRRIAAGKVEFVLLAPEQLVSDDVLEALQVVSVDRLVVDEAHCVDAWGADFRPDFLRLAPARAALGSPPCLALTATAAPHVREQIAMSLAMRDPAVLVGGTERDNIRLGVSAHVDNPATRAAVIDEVGGRAGSGLVYVATRADAEGLAAALGDRHRPALAYHGSLGASERARVHRAFRSVRPIVVVATSAFGLGVDAPHVRFVVHHDAPETIDAYYQEVGRAGRDGEPAAATLHVTRGTASRRRFASGSSVPSVGLCAAVAQVDSPTDGDALRHSLRQPRGRFLQAAMLLVAHDVVRLDHRMVLRPGRRRWPDASAEVEAVLTDRAALLTSRRQMMDRFVDADTCRWASVAGYLGDVRLHACGHCDVCETDGARRRTTSGSTTIHHQTFGAGVIVEEHDDTLVVLFHHAGYRTLSRALLDEGGLVAVAHVSSGRPPSRRDR